MFYIGRDEEKRLRISWRVLILDMDSRGKDLKRGHQGRFERWYRQGSGKLNREDDDQGQRAAGRSQRWLQ